MSAVAVYMILVVLKLRCSKNLKIKMFGYTYSELSLQLRVLTALLENPGLIPST